MTGTRVAAVVPAAGRGTRFGSGQNKIWAKVRGRTVIEWTLGALDAHPEVDAIVVAGNPSDLGRLKQIGAPYRKLMAIVPGGASRQESVGSGLTSLPTDCEIVLVHDAARPALSPELISRIVSETRRHGAAVPGLPVTDTLKRADREGVIEATVERDGLWAVQTPQGARLDMLRAAYSALGPRVAGLTDEAGVLASAGYAVRVVKGEESNVKVTRPDDLERAARALAALEGVETGVTEREVREDGSASSLTHTAAPGHPTSSLRVGFGYDVHPLAAGRDLWLGGVRIPHDRGLAGHSDADALLHAVCDALLGAAGLGDIGVLFPDSDQAHKDRPSVEFLMEVRRLLDQAGWDVLNIDVSLLAEAPRIGPHRARMAETIAGALGVAPCRVNIKATTSEGMGFVGRQEGIACWAIAAVQASARGA